MPTEQAWWAQQAPGGGSGWGAWSQFAAAHCLLCGLQNPGVGRDVSATVRRSGEAA